MISELKIPYIDIGRQHHSIKEELLEAVGKVFDRGDFILGEEVNEFENRFAELNKMRFALGVNSGTDALILALRVLGIGPGDEVITAPNSFVASASCIALVGAIPVFVDVGDDYNLDPNKLHKAITHKTKAVIPVHLTGRPANMDPIIDIANNYHLKIIEDCAQAILAEYKDRLVGSMGQIGCFSLHPLKTLNACGDGGVLTTNDENIYEQLKTLRNIGLKTRDDCVIWSGNSRLDTLQAAILLVKMKYLDEWTEKRRANAMIYQQELADVTFIQTPVDRPYEKAVYHTFVIQAERRDDLKQHLAKNGIGSSIHYPIPIHLHKAASRLGYAPGSFPVTERQAKRILSLPIYPELSKANIQYIVQTIKKFYSN